MEKLSRNFFLLLFLLIQGCNSVKYNDFHLNKVHSNHLLGLRKNSNVEEIKLVDTTTGVYVKLDPYFNGLQTKEGFFYIQYFDGESNQRYFRASDQPLLFEISKNTEFLLVNYQFKSVELQRCLFKLKQGNCYAFSFYIQSSMFLNGDTSNVVSE